MPTWSADGAYTSGLGAGDEISSTYEGRHLRMLESNLVHPTHTDGFVDKGDQVVCGNIVGVSFKSAAAATEYVEIDSEGIWSLTATATDEDGNSAIAIGDEIFINITTGVLSKDRNKNTHQHFGYALSVLTSGTTGTICIKIHWDPDDSLEKVGSSAAYLDSDVAGKIFREYRYSFSGTTGDVRGMYLRLNIIEACAGGEALRAFTNCNDVEVATAHGAHLSLDFGSTGNITGLGCGSRSTLHIPNYALVGGTYCGGMSELYADGVASDIGGTTVHSIHRFVMSGDGTGAATGDNVFEFVGLSGTQFAANAASTTHVMRVIVNGTIYYLLLGDTLA